MANVKILCEGCDDVNEVPYDELPDEFKKNIVNDSIGGLLCEKCAIEIYRVPPARHKEKFDGGEIEYVHSQNKNEIIIINLGFRKEQIFMAKAAVKNFMKTMNCNILANINFIEREPFNTVTEAHKFYIKLGFVVNPDHYDELKWSPS